MTTVSCQSGRVIALSGGVGGAKLAFGLNRVVGGDLTLVVNTADDFEHLGLSISPDIDTALYTLSGLANRELGWGRRDESWNFMGALGALGGETWFRLGDRDLALHIERTRRLRRGEPLTSITSDIAGRLGIAAEVLPMSDAPVRTIVDTEDGALPFQRYFVERRCVPRVRAIAFEGAAQAKASPQVVAAFRDPKLRAILLCPSNPFLSIDPILSVPGIRALIKEAGVPVVAVSPIIGGKAVKGPTDKIMAELDVPATSATIAKHYRGFLSGLVIDGSDAAERGTVECAVHVTATLMRDEEDRVRLAHEVLAFASHLAESAPVGGRE
jgi:LPPG:FO 2-phospho-L-lactate transferase